MVFARQERNKKTGKLAEVQTKAHIRCSLSGFIKQRPFSHREPGPFSIEDHDNQDIWLSACCKNYTYVKSRSMGRKNIYINVSSSLVSLF